MVLSKTGGILMSKKIAWNKGKIGIYSQETIQRWSEIRKGRKLSYSHKRNLEAAKMIAVEKKSQELWSRTCNVDPSHKPYIHKQSNNPTWFKDKNDPEKFVCGLCHYNQIKVLKYKTNEERQNAHSKFMKTNNPMYEESAKKKLSKTRTGVPLGPCHSDEFKEQQRQKWSGKNNPNYGGLSDEQRKKLSETRKRRIATGEIKLAEQKKGKESPLYGKPRPQHVIDAISKANKGKVLSEETKEKLRQKRLHQKNIGQKGISTPHLKMHVILEELGIEYRSEVFGITGRPDTMIGEKLIIFTDGDFWHANPSPYLHRGKIQPGIPDDKRLGKNLYAKEKREYDNKITQRLRSDGYTVLRFWDSEIEHTPELIIKKILATVQYLKEKREVV